MAITYRRFGTNYRSHLRGSRYPTTVRNIPEERRPESTYNKGCGMCGMVLPVTTQWLLCIPPAQSVMKSECFSQNLFTDDSTEIISLYSIRWSVCIADMTHLCEVGKDVLWRRISWSKQQCPRVGTSRSKHSDYHMYHVFIGHNICVSFQECVDVRYLSEQTA